MATAAAGRKTGPAAARRQSGKRKERKNIPHGVAAIAATFNNQSLKHISEPTRHAPIACAGFGV
jgi:ribosomal protein S11